MEHPLPPPHGHSPFPLCAATLLRLGLRLGLRLAPALLAASFPMTSHAQECEPAWISGEPVPGIAPGEARDMVVYDDGNGPALYIGGMIHTAGTLPASALVRWDGTSFSTIGTLESGGPSTPAISALAVYDGKLAVGGSFRYADGIDVFNVATWDGTDWSALGTGVTGGQGGVWDLYVHDGKLIATGSFNTAGGVAASNIAEWDGTSWFALGAGLSGSGAIGRALASFDGDLVAGGSFFYADGDTARGVARWNGASWSPLGSGLPTSVYALCTFDLDGGGPGADRLIAGGGFLSTTGIDDLAWWDGAAWHELDGGTQNSVFALLPSGSDLLVGGFFTGVGGPAGNAQHIARWTPGAGWSSFGAGLNEDIGGTHVYALTEFGGSLYACGNFRYADQQATYRIARWDGTEWLALSPGIGGGDGASILDFVPWGDGVVAAGRFTSVGDAVDANNIAVWSPSGWSALGAGLGDGEYNGADGGEWVYDLTLHEGELYAARYNYNGSGDHGPRVSHWDGATWEDIAVNETANDNLRAVHSHAGELYAAGSFTTIDGYSASRVARWDGSDWWPLQGANGNGVNGTVHTLSSFEGDLLVGGTLAEAGGAPANRIARWDGSEWSDMGATLLGSPNVHCFAVHDGALHAGTANGVHRWDGAAWTRILGSGTVRSLLSVGADLYLTGRFTTVAGVPVENIARWDGTTVHAIGDGLHSPGGGGGFFFGPSGYALALLPDGTIAVGSNDLHMTLDDGTNRYCFGRIDPCPTVSDVDSNPWENDPLLDPHLDPHPDARVDEWRGLELHSLPFAQGAGFALSLPRRADVRVVVLDLQGRSIGSWQATRLEPGHHRLGLASIADLSRGLPSGVYFGRLDARAAGRIAYRTARTVFVRGSGGVR